MSLVRSFGFNETVEFALIDLFAHNIHVVRIVHLLQGFDRESREDTDDRSDKKACPEGGFGINLRGCVVKRPRISCRSVHARPEENEEVTDDNNQEHDPVPSVGVDEDVQVDSEHRRVGNVTSKAEPVGDIETVKSNVVTVDHGEIRDEEDHDGLVDTVQHVEPRASLALTACCEVR